VWQIFQAFGLLQTMFQNYTPIEYFSYGVIEQGDFPGHQMGRDLVNLLKSGKYEHILN